MSAEQTTIRGPPAGRVPRAPGRHGARGRRAPAVRSPRPCPTRVGWPGGWGSWSRPATCGCMEAFGAAPADGRGHLDAGRGGHLPGGRDAARPRAPCPRFTVVGGVDTTAAVDPLPHTGSPRVDGVAWSSIVTAGSRVIARGGGARRTCTTSPRSATGCSRILRSLEDQHATGFMRLRFEQGAVIGASLGRHALVASRSRRPRTTSCVAIIDEIRAILAGHDLASVTTEFDPSAEPVRRHGRAEPAGPCPLARPSRSVRATAAWASARSARAGAALFGR